MNINTDLNINTNINTNIKNSLIFKKPDDWHVHFRDGDFLEHTVNATAAQFARALVMPNLKPPIQTAADAELYYQRITAVLAPENKNFKAYLCLYLTQQTSEKTIIEAKKQPYILGVKWYPTGATTNSEQGISNIKQAYPVLEAMQKQGLVLMVHGEVVENDVDIFDREAIFIDKVLSPLRRDFPELKISFEHITTKAAVDFVKTEASPYLGASITPQHLLFDRNHLLKGGIRPHYYCLPILKTKQDQVALQAAAKSGLPYFYAGSDTAPHDQKLKENACGCAGCYTGLHALELYIQSFMDDDFFESEQNLKNMEAFLSINGAKFYGLNIENEILEYIAKPWQIPSHVNFGDVAIIPLAAGTYLNYQKK